MADITIPYNYQPRFYQLPFFEAMDNGKKRSCLVWHRRSGKTVTLLNFACKKAFERVGVYYHCFPEYNQARKIVWDGITKDGKPFLDHIPKELRASKNSTELKVELINVSIYQLVGADNFDRLVGPNPVGLIMDEWAVSDKYPMAWDYFRPILAENQGWAVFNFTPRGRNHGFDLYSMALRNPEWFCQLLTADDTQAINKRDIEAERGAGMSEDMIQQEFYCTFLASTEDIVIPFHLIQAALSRNIEPEGIKMIAGCDPARYGNDRTGFVIRKGGQIVHVDSWRNLDVTQVAGKLIALHKLELFDRVAIDVIGLGAGVYDIARRSIPCIPVNVGEATSSSDRFRRLRDELWWKLREWFEDLSCSISHAISQQQRQALISDLQDIHYEYDLQGRIVIESKDKMKERIGFSPDIGDALCLTFAPGAAISNANYTPNRKAKPYNVRRPRL